VWRYFRTEYGLILLVDESLVERPATRRSHYTVQWRQTVAAAPRSPPRIACSTGLQVSATLGEMGRSREEVVGSVVDNVVLYKSLGPRAALRRSQEGHRQNTGSRKLETRFLQRQGTARWPFCGARQSRIWYSASRAPACHNEAIARSCRWGSRAVCGLVHMALIEIDQCVKEEPTIFRGQVWWVRLIDACDADPHNGRSLVFDVVNDLSIGGRQSFAARCAHFDVLRIIRLWCPVGSGYGATKYVLKWGHCETRPGRHGR